MPTSTRINPTVGRVVLFFFHCAACPGTFVPAKKGEPLAATVAAVLDDGRLNLSVSDHYGAVFPFTGIPLLQEGDDPVEGSYATWMPYQLAKAEQEKDKPASSDPIGVCSVMVPSIDPNRNIALEAALRTYGETFNPEAVLAAANQYLAFLQTGTVPEKAPE